MNFTTVEVVFPGSRFAYTYLVHRGLAKQIGRDGLAIAQVGNGLGYAVVRLKKLHKQPRFEDGIQLKWVISAVPIMDELKLKRAAKKIEKHVRNQKNNA